MILAVGVNLTRALRGGDELSLETTPADNAFPATPACCRERGAACEGDVPAAPSARVAACSGGSLWAVCVDLSLWAVWAGEKIRIAEPKLPERKTSFSNIQARDQGQAIIRVRFSFQ